MSPTAVPADFYATALSILSSNASVTVAGSSGRPEVHPAVYLYGFCLVLIPTATILGNLLVIMSVLRFKALHSAINFLILGLAVADLLVAVSVMPYAVYIYVQGGSWYLGPLMCDIYSAFDVACSTASILLLAVISFDRYRAVSRPIQYSRQSQNIRRVVMIIIIIWVISLALASPMVLGVNNRPADANPHECRFYNPEFSIGSSIVSFVIPCFVVLFVYIRIMMALRKREMAARARRQANQASEGNKSYDGSDEAGQIVAGPAVNVMMLALPSMTRRIKSYERQRAAVEEAGEEELLDDEEMEAEGTSGDEDDNDNDSDGGSVFEDPAAATDDSGIGRRRGSSAVPVVKKRKKSSKKQPVRGAPSRSLPITNSKPAVTSQALCLSSFLPILGTATSAVRRTGSVSPRKLNVMALAAEDSLRGGILDGISPKGPKGSKLPKKSNQNNTPKPEKRQPSARSHRSCSDAPLLTTKSPLMLQRFMADTTDAVEQLDVSRLVSRSEPLYRRANNTIHDHDLAGSSSPHSSTDSLSENVHVVTNDFVSEGPTSMSRRSSDFDSSFANNTVSSLNSSNLLDKSDRSGVSDEKRYRRGFRQTPGFGRRSFTMPSMGQNTVKRRNTTGLREPFLPNFLRQLSRRSPRIFRRVDAYPCKAYTIGGNHHMAEVIENCDTATPVKKALYRSGEATDDDETDKFLIVTTPNGVPQANECQSTRTSQGSAVSSSPNSTLNAIIRRSVTTNDAAEIEDKHEAPTATIDEDFEGTDVEDFEDGPDVSLATTSASGRVGLVIANQAASDVSPVHRVENKRIRNLAPKAETDSPSVSFNIAGKTFFGGRSHHHSEGNSSLPPISTMRRRSSCAENLSESNKLSGGGDSCGITSSVSSNVISSGENGSKKQAKRHPKHMKSQYSMDSFGSTAAPSISSGGKGSETRKKHNHAKLNGSSTALAVRIVKKTINRKESSLKRKVTKAQRKERRATKTLGIVVGIFLICWVPFFSINILNAICVRLENEACQIGFGPFFYTTWIGYMNSFMNPIIYTIFNTEFRRAFKSLILGRNAARRHNRAHNV